MSDQYSAIAAKILPALRSYRLSYMRCVDDDSGYPLVDRLTPEGHTVATGIEEIERLADYLAGEIFPPETPPAVG